MDAARGLAGWFGQLHEPPEQELNGPATFDKAWALHRQHAGAPIIVSRTELRTTIPVYLPANAGKPHIIIRDLEPPTDYDWGGEIQYGKHPGAVSFTTAWSHNRY